MRPKAAYIYGILYSITDMATILVAWVLSYQIRFYSLIESPLGIPNPSLYYKLCPFILLIWSLISALNRTYNWPGCIKSKLAQLQDIMKSSILLVLGLISFNYFYEEYRYSRIVLMIFSCILPFSLIMGRVIASYIGKHYHLHLNKRKTLLIACDSNLKNFIQSRESNLDMDIIGVVIPSYKSKESDQKFLKEKGIKEVPFKQSWAELFTTHPSQSVVVTLPYSQHWFLEENLDQITNQVPDVKIIPDVSRYTKFGIDVGMLGSIPVVHIHNTPLDGFNSAVKRLTDILGSSLALLVFTPIMALIALLIKFSSKGPILYKQKRMGLDGRTFMCLKFRSMPVNAEASTGAIWATPADNRATPLGSFLRRSSLDELPQLLNVLKGDMSLVGPRPERPVFVDEFRKNIPGYMLRHKVKTGITGWAQVNGWRGSTSIEKRIECDLYYIQNWSLWLDLKILLMTIEEVIASKNAY